MEVERGREEKVEEVNCKLLLTFSYLYMLRHTRSTQIENL